MTLRRYELQEILFSDRPLRRELLEVDLSGKTEKVVTVNVWRNHAFENLKPLIEPYCLFGNWQAIFNIGPYDDSFMFSDWRQADIELLWLDSSRFSLGADWQDWLHDRLGALRAISGAPIILATWADARELDKITVNYPAIYYADLKRVCDEAQVDLLDFRTSKFAGTPVSNHAQLIVARELACHWLPAVVFPPVKAIAIDLDNTLHDGVLGEDGADGVNLSSGHNNLQIYMKSLSRNGIFIALISRNEHIDVEALFTQRKDYPLRWEDFSETEISWGDKSSAIERLAGSLRISTDSILFVDDNIGELVDVAMRLPQVKTVYAHHDADLTRQVIHFFPGIWQWSVKADDAKRVQDMKMNAVREAIGVNASSPIEYFRSLQVALTYFYDSEKQLCRIADLCNKTNQFNLAIRRFNEVELAECLINNDKCVASVQLTDRLSDSGVIAVIVAERRKEQVIVEELCISCRALGRQLESTILLIALRGMCIFEGCHDVVFKVQHGARNQPALKWLADLQGDCDLPSPGLYTVPIQRLLNFQAAEGIDLVKG